MTTEGANFSLYRARKMKSDLCEGSENDKYNGIVFVAMSKTFVMHNVFLFCNRTF